MRTERPERASVNGSFSTGQPAFPRENLVGYGPVAGPSGGGHFEREAGWHPTPLTLLRLEKKS